MLLTLLGGEYIHKQSVYLDKYDNDILFSSSCSPYNIINFLSGKYHGFEIRTTRKGKIIRIFYFKNISQALSYNRKNYLLNKKICY